MRITKIDIATFDAAFHFDYHSTHLLRQKADSVIVTLGFDDGLTGYGESVPRPYVTGESPASVIALVRNLFAGIVVGRQIDSVGDVARLLDELKRVCVRQGVRACQSALGAVDVALLDALGKQRGLPVFRLLGPEMRRELPWSLPIPLLPEEKVRQFWAGIKRGRGTFSSLKLLASRDGQENVKRLKLVRSIFGEEIEIRIEVNGNWTRTEARSQIPALTPFGIAALEQPVAKEDHEGLREIRETFGIPVIVDESLCGPEDAETLIDGQACDILNIKISKVGGLLAAMRIATLAASRGKACLLGAHVGETEILTGAALHFLIAAPTLSLVEGFSSLLFDPTQRIDDLDPKPRIAALFWTTGIGFNPAASVLAGQAARVRAGEA
jgi:muconate cycloisomerase